SDKSRYQNDSATTWNSSPERRSRGKCRIANWWVVLCRKKAGVPSSANTRTAPTWSRLCSSNGAKTVREKTVSWLDSSAVLTLLYGEAGMDIVRELLERSERDRGAVYLSAVTLTEVVSTLRSEEHTSELQSRSDLVCRLLLEK